MKRNLDVLFMFIIKNNNYLMDGNGGISLTSKSKVLKLLKSKVLKLEGGDSYFETQSSKHKVVST